MADSKKIISGDSSQNVQGNNVYIINVGEAYDINRALTMRDLEHVVGVGLDKAFDRRERFIKDEIEKIVKRNSDNLNAFSDPFMQMASRNAQIEYIRRDDDDLKDILTNILCDISAMTGNSFVKLVLNEAITQSAKLTAPQLNTISLVFIFYYMSTPTISSPESFDLFMNNTLGEITSNVATSQGIKHIIYSGCAVTDSIHMNLFALLSRHYPEIFYNGFRKEDAILLGISEDQWNNYFIEDAHGQRFVKFNNSMFEKAFGTEVGIKLRNAVLSRRTSNYSSELIEKKYPVLKYLEDNCKSLIPTPVGMAIAIQWLRIKTTLQINEFDFILE